MAGLKRLMRGLFGLGVAIALSGCPAVPPSDLPSEPNASPSLVESVPETPSPTAEDAIPMSSTVDFEVLDLGASPAMGPFVSDPKAMVFHNAQEWSQFWNQGSGGANRQPPGEIDFETQMVIGLTPGSRPTGGYRIEVDRIEVVDGQNQRWVVHYVEKAPDRSCFVTQQMTIPTAFIVTEPTEVPVDLQGKQQTYSC